MNAVAPFTKWLKTCNEQFARFSGSQFSPHELPEGPPCEGRAPVRQATKLCRDCRKREVRRRQRYCPHCARNHIRESKRKHMSRKRGSDVEKVANSSTGAEALTRPENEVRYDDPKTTKTASNFSTQKEAP
jgi:hypothetical protein